MYSRKCLCGVFTVLYTDLFTSRCVINLCVHKLEKYIPIFLLLAF